jgi:uncharacterized repeat protein (TIGR01451 family)
MNLAPQVARARRSLAALVGLLLVACLASPAQGQERPDAANSAATATGSGPLETEIVAERFLLPQSPEEGVARFVSAGRLEAGDEVYYTIRVRNPGKEPVLGAEITKRLPLGMHYVAGSATGPACDVAFSMDGGVTFPADIDPAQITHVRWALRRPLAPGATALLRFRAIFR